MVGCIEDAPPRPRGRQRETAMQRIVKYTKRLETSIVVGGCPRDRLFLSEQLCWSDMFHVPSPQITDDEYAAQNLMHTMVVEVFLRRARQPYEGRWGWVANKYERIALTFYHYDHIKLQQHAADWLDQHYDTTTPDYQAIAGTDKRKDYFVRTLNIPIAGRYRHYTNPLPETTE